jgi:uncharacterized membrane protein YhhN
LLTQRWQPFAGSALVKGCAVGALALLALRSRGERRDAGVLALGLAFSTAGDVLLDLDARWFAFGLGAFLLAHLTYICLFARNRTRWNPAGPAARLAAVLLILVYSATLSVWIVPSVGALAVPVVLYICALTTMVCGRDSGALPATLGGGGSDSVSDFGFAARRSQIQGARATARLSGVDDLLSGPVRHCAGIFGERTSGREKSKNRETGP